MTYQIHSTRLPKSTTTINQLTGIATKCDIVIVQDKIIYINLGQPKTIFVSMYLEISFQLLIEKIIPTLTSPVTIILASEDATFPLGIGDKRPRMQRPYTRNHAKQLLQSTLVTKIFVENLDVYPTKNPSYSKLYPLPLGVLSTSNTEIVTSVNFSESNRIHKCFCCHRTRSRKAQWSERAKVNKRCVKDWVECVDSFDELGNGEFMEALSRYNFTICVHGGGIDPSPKAWEAIMRGSIPIIRESPVAEAYRLLPVVIIPTFDKADAISLEKMYQWLEKYRGWYENIGLRKKVIERLSMDYWWQKISK